MGKKIFSQFGTFSVAIMVPVLVFCLVMFFLTGIDEPVANVVLGFVIITFIICLLIFYKITITIDEESVSFSMGIGLVKKRYPLSEIKSCRAVRNSPLYGIGIRMLVNGWLYNVSGTYAVELEFKNRKSVVRIGTDKPEEVAAYICTKIGTTITETSGPRSGNKGYIWLMVTVVLALAFPVILVMTGGRETEVEITAEALVIKGMYGMTINYSDSIQISLSPSLPSIRVRTNGYAAGNTLKGNFKLQDGSAVKLFVRKNNPPYIRIINGTQTVWLNSEDPEKTRELFSKLIPKAIVILL